MRGGEEVERDVWGEDFLREGSREEGGEMFLKDTECCYLGDQCLRGTGDGQGHSLFPSLRVRSSGGLPLSLPTSSGVRRGLELVNHISRKISRPDWTWASERHGEKKVVRSTT